MRIGVKRFTGKGSNPDYPRVPEISGFCSPYFYGYCNSALINILLGIFGGFLARQLGNKSENDGLVMHLLISVVGAIILIFIGRLF